MGSPAVIHILNSTMNQIASPIQRASIRPTVKYAVSLALLARLALRVISAPKGLKVTQGSTALKVLWDQRATRATLARRV